LAELTGVDAEPTGAPGMSTSFLATGDDALAAELGVVVLGQVIGACANSLGAGVLRALGPGSADRHRPGEPRWLERSGIVDSWTTARRRALSRLQDQAAMLGADAVVGVQVSRRQREFGAEVVLSGSGVRLGVVGRTPPRRVTPPAPEAAVADTGEVRARPVVTSISLTQLAKLRVAGAEPAGLVGGCASVAALPSIETTRSLRRRRRRGRRSREIDEFSFALREAWRRAVARLRVEAADLGADGVLGISLDDLRTSGGGGDFQVVLHLLGTAVQRGRAAPHTTIGPTLGTGPGDR
jgi:uncharacterized protein YbjQ (UPF0145 family)